MTLKTIKDQSPILVTGASGFVGSRLVTALISKQIPVVAFYRTKLPISSSLVYPFCSSGANDDLLKTPIRDVKTAVHLAWDSSKFSNSKKNPKESSDSNIVYLKKLLKALENSGVKKIIFLSILGAKKDSSLMFLREKYFAESLILNSNIEEKVIIQCPFIFNDLDVFDHFTQEVLKYSFLPGLFPLPGTKNIPLMAISQMVKILDDMVFLNEKNSFLRIFLDRENKNSIRDVFECAMERRSLKHKIVFGQFFGRVIFSILDRFFTFGSFGFSLGDYLKELENSRPQSKEIGVGQEFSPKGLSSFSLYKDSSKKSEEQKA